MSVALGENEEQLFVVFTFVYVLCVGLPPAYGDAAFSARRKHLCHAVLASVFSIAAIIGAIPDAPSVWCSICAFYVDLWNMFITDTLVPTHPDKRSTNKLARALEYFHHFFCLVIAYVSLTSYGHCPGMINVFGALSSNEISTIFLQLYRHYKSTLTAVLFCLSFFLIRIVFNLYYFSPRVYVSCRRPLFYYLWVPYMSLQMVFFSQIVQKTILTVCPKPRAKTKDD